MMKTESLAKLINCLAEIIGADDDPINDAFAMILEISERMISEDDRMTLCRAFDLCYLHSCDIDQCLDDRPNCPETDDIRKAR